MPKSTPKQYGTTKPPGARKFRPIAARAPEEFHEALDDFVERTGLDKSEIIRKATAQAIGFDVNSLPGKRAA